MQTSCKGLMCQRPPEIARVKTSRMQDGTRCRARPPAKAGRSDSIMLYRLPDV